MDLLLEITSVPMNISSGGTMKLGLSKVGKKLGNDRTPEIEVRPDGRTSLLRSGRTPDRTGPDRPAGHNAGP